MTISRTSSVRSVDAVVAAPEPEAPAETPVVLPDAPLETTKFENPEPTTSTVDRLAPHGAFDKHQRLAAIVSWLARLGGPAVTIAAGLWVTGCATTDRTAPRRARPLPKPPTEQMSQLDHPTVWLGRGEKRTIAEAGCFLTSLAMASEAMTDLDWDPVRANDAVKAGGGFSGPALELDEATRALGLRVNWRGALGKSNVAARHGALDRHLDSKRVAVASVDFRAGASSGESEGDHFILIYGKSADSYFAVDPLGGQLVELKPGADGFLTYGPEERYRVCELCLLSPR